MNKEQEELMFENWKYQLQGPFDKEFEYLETIKDQFDFFMISSMGHVPSDCNLILGCTRNADQSTNLWYGMYSILVPTKNLKRITIP